MAEQNTNQRDSFVFYRTFYDAIRCMSEKVQYQIYVAIVEYALDDKEPDETLSKEAHGMFTLIRPMLDANIARFRNGKKGGRRGKSQTKPIILPDMQRTPAAPAVPAYNLTFDEEVAQMKQDTIWNEPVCIQYRITPEDLNSRLDTFNTHCKCEWSDKPHTDISDAKRHFLAWMRKVYPITKKSSSKSDTTDYTYSGGFGSKDT